MKKMIVCCIFALSILLSSQSFGLEKVYTIRGNLKNVLDKVKELEKPSPDNPIIPDEVKYILKSYEFKIGGDVWTKSRYWEGHVYLKDSIPIVPFLNIAIIDQLDKTVEIWKISDSEVRVRARINLFLRQNDWPRFYPNRWRFINKIKNRKINELEHKILRIEEEKLREFLQD